MFCSCRLKIEKNYQQSNRAKLFAQPQEGADGQKIQKKNKNKNWIIVFTQDLRSQIEDAFSHRAFRQQDEVGLCAMTWIHSILIAYHKVHNNHICLLAGAIFSWLDCWQQSYNLS